MPPALCSSVRKKIPFPILTFCLHNLLNKFGFYDKIYIPVKNIITGCDHMEKITVLPGFQITIPREIRKKFRLQPGQEVRIILVEDRIEIVPVKQEEESQEAMARE